MGLIPSNAAAREIARIRSENADRDTQTAELRRAQDRASETIGALALTAQWIEPEPEPVAEGMETQ